MWVINLIECGNHLSSISQLSYPPVPPQCIPNMNEVGFINYPEYALVLIAHHSDT